MKINFGWAKNIKIYYQILRKIILIYIYIYMNYEQKYLKYKEKYLALKAKLDGGLFDEATSSPNNS